MPFSILNSNVKTQNGLRSRIVIIHTRKYYYSDIRITVVCIFLVLKSTYWTQMAYSNSFVLLLPP